MMATGGPARAAGCTVIIEVGMECRPEDRGQVVRAKVIMPALVRQPDLHLDQVAAQSSVTTPGAITSDPVEGSYGEHRWCYRRKV